MLGGWLVLTVLPVLVFRWVDPPTTSFMLQRRLEASSSHEKGFRLQQRWVPRSRISDHLVQALVAAEDHRFTEHHGFDWDALENALEAHVRGTSKRGGSTLTQQVAKNLFLWPDRSYVRKALEAYFTVLLELLWSKQRILEVHLNIAEYGNGIYGVDSACRIFFGKSPASVTREEAARLVVVLPAPKSRRANAPSAKSREHIDWILEQMNQLQPAQLEGL